MEINKIEDSNRRCSIELKNDKNQSFLMQFSGADFYWIMLHYDEHNEFNVTEDDSFLFSKMQQLFKIIQKYDDPYNKTLINNTFTWDSEDYGIYEKANKLIITFQNNTFSIRFYQNPNREFNNKFLCPICFCLSGSKNEIIASAFSSMFLKCQNYQNNFTNICKKLIK